MPPVVRCCCRRRWRKRSSAMRSRPFSSACPWKERGCEPTIDGPPPDENEPRRDGMGGAKRYREIFEVESSADSIGSDDLLGLGLGEGGGGGDAAAAAAGRSGGGRGRIGFVFMVGGIGVK
ncbi:hypothetical protein ACHAWF_018363 [Thalassiosira exigua]